MAASQAPDLFLQARDEFLASLQPSHRSLFKECTNGQELLKEVESFMEFAGKHSRLRRHVLVKVKRLSDSLQPYFDVLGIIVQAHPEYAAIFYGAIRLLFQLAANFEVFFEKLANALVRIGEKLPQYDDLANSAQQIPPRIQSSITKVYTDIFKFFESVVNVFTKKDGGPKRPYKVIGGLIWKPFDTRFQELLETLTSHEQLVRDEVLLNTYNSAHRILSENTSEHQNSALERAKADTERQAQSVSRQTVNEIQRLLDNQLKKVQGEVKFRLLRWLAPPRFSQAYQRARRVREMGTSDWFFTENKLIHWVESSVSDPLSNQIGQRCLWVHGKPGSGKTILAAAAIEELNQSISNNGESTCICYFFFTLESPSSSTDTISAAYSSILAQILHNFRHDEDILDKFAFAMNEGATGQIHASREELLELLQACAMGIKLLIILDGLDECSEIEELIRDLRTAFEYSTTKFLFFSRPSISALSRLVPPQHRLAIGHSNSADIRLFISRRLDTLLTNRLISPGSNKNLLIDHLATGADGMFLWARLMFNYLNARALTRMQRYQTIMKITFPEGLDEMYTRIVTLIRKRQHVDMGLAEWVIGLLAHSKRNMSTEEMQYAIKEFRFIQGSSLSMHDDESVEEFEEAVLGVCASLVEIEEFKEVVLDLRSGLLDETPKRSSFRFIHLSALEYFGKGDEPSFKSSTDSERYSHILTMSKGDFQCELTRICLQHLTYRIPAQPLGGKTNSPTALEQIRISFPFCEYATNFWPSHLYDVVTDVFAIEGKMSRHVEALRITISQFLQQRLALMSWVEASYTSKVESISLKTENNSSTGVGADLMELSQYLERLEKDWGHKLLQSPHLIWEEVTGFTSSRLFMQSSSVEVLSLVGTCPRAGLSSTPLCKIFGTSSNGELVTILAIWPTQKYVDWVNLAIKHSEQFTWPGSELHLLCTGWMAQYDIWSTSGTPARVAEFKFGLPEDEVFIQITQSQSAKGVQFPVSLVKDARIFSILRTVYAIHPQTGKLNSFCLSVDGVDFSLAACWERWKSLFAHRKEPFAPSKGPNRKPEHYLYDIWFSESGHSLIFADHGITQPIILAAFQLEMTGVLTVSLKAQITLASQSTLSLAKPNEIIFHPQLPLIAGLTSKDAFLWGCDTEQTLRKFPLALPPTHISFSLCGKYLLVNHYRSTVVTVHPISAEVEKDLDKGKKSIIGSPIAPKSASTLSREIAIAGTRTMGADSIISGNQTSSLSATGNLEAHRVCVADNTVLIESQTNRWISGILEKQTRLRAGSLQLVHLPDSLGNVSKSATVRLPKEGDPHLQIVVNKTTSSENIVMPESNDKLPMIIHRDTRSLKRRYQAANQTALEFAQDEHSQSGEGWTSKSELIKFAATGGFEEADEDFWSQFLDAPASKRHNKSLQFLDCEDAT